MGIIGSIFMGGVKEYMPSPGNPFLFPVIWMVVFVTIPFILLNYPMRDMQGIGQQILIRSRGRSLWWLSKCCWNLFATLLYHLVLVCMSLLLCLVFRIPISDSINMDFLSAVFNIGAEAVMLQSAAIPVLVFALPPLISTCINMAQMALSLFIKPVLSFLTVLALLVSSVYLLAPYMIGNYAMPIRHDWVIQNGLPYQTGFIIAAVLMILSVVIGLFRFRFFDILNKD